MTPIIQARDLARWYGLVLGLNEVNLDVPGGITGIVGPNGAGKSTFIQLLTGQMRPSRGRLEVLGLTPFANPDLYRRLGYCPAKDALPENMTARSFVTTAMRLHGLGHAPAREAADRALKRLDLLTDADRRIGGYSKGMRQRTKLAQALAHDPELVIADEPLTGLDPGARRSVIRLFTDLRRRGIHVVVSSHVLHEVEGLVDQVVLVDRGRVAAHGNVDSIREGISRHPRQLLLRATKPRRLGELLFGRADVLSVRVGPHPQEILVETSDLDGLLAELSHVIESAGAGVHLMDCPDVGLEAVFDYLVP